MAIPMKQKTNSSTCFGSVIYETIYVSSYNFNVVKTSQEIFHKQKINFFVLLLKLSTETY